MSAANVLSGAARWSVEQGECLAALREMPDASVDAVITDPPAGIAFMGKHWDGDRGGRAQWVAWLAEILAECVRVMKPGAHALVWALPRTSHWTATACEDAGLLVRDVVVHLQGQGFPKSKALLKPGAEHWVLCRAPGELRELNIDACRVRGAPGRPGNKRDSEPVTNPSLGVKRTMGASYSAKLDAGEIGGRWPANVVLSHAPECECVGTRRVRGSAPASGPTLTGESTSRARGRFAGVAATATHVDADGMETVEDWHCAPDCPVAMLDAQSGVLVSHGGGHRTGLGYGSGARSYEPIARGDKGGASRFYFCAKADREPGNTHPTVKPLALMRWLCRLVTPSGGVVLDPFTGSGTTGVACGAEDFRFVGIEREAEYVAIARMRCEAAFAQTTLFDALAATKRAGGGT